MTTPSHTDLFKMMWALVFVFPSIQAREQIETVLIISNFHVSAQIFFILSRGSLISIDRVSTVQLRKSTTFAGSLTNFPCN